MTAERHPLRGILLMLGATLCFALLDGTAKHLTARYPVPMLVWARYTLHFVLMLIVFAPHLGGKLIATRRPRLQTTRALMLVGVTALNMAALHYLPLAETTALLFVAPFVVALLAGPFLGETLRPVHWLAIIAGFGGVLLIARPGGTLDPTGLAFALAAALCYSIYQVQTRMLAPTENTLTMLFYTALVGTLSMTLAAPLYWSGPWPETATDALLVASLGIYGATGHFMLISAFRHAAATTLSPLLYVQLVWAALIGWIFFGHWPDGMTLAGIVIIATSSIALALARRRSPATSG